MLKIGHRGAMGYEPENTLASFQKAIFLGVDMVELDVHLCKTGELVVMHDETLERTTNGSGRVEEKTIADLKELDAGNGQKIPTLAEVFDLIDKNIQINIELKGKDTAKPLAELIEQYLQKGWGKELFFVSSFNHGELKRFKELMPDVRVGFATRENPSDCVNLAKNMNAWSVNSCFEFTDQKFIDQAHGNNLKVLAWTVNELRDIERMKALGVDGIISNFPDRI